MKKFFVLLIIVVSSYFSCGTSDYNRSDIEIPESNLYKTISDLVNKNGYLVLFYTNGNQINSFTYDTEMESIKSFDFWSWSGTSEELNITVTVKDDDNNIVAQIYSTDKNDKAKIMENSFLGKKNAKVVFLNHPSKSELITAYNKMMNGL